MTTAERRLAPQCADCPVGKYWVRGYPEPLPLQRKRIAAFEQISEQVRSEDDIRKLFRRANWSVTQDQVADFAVALVFVPAYLEDLREKAANYDDEVEKFDVLGDTITNVTCYGTERQIAIDPSGDRFYKPVCTNRDAFRAAASCRDSASEYPDKITNLHLQFIQLYSAHVMAKLYDGRAK